MITSASYGALRFYDINLRPGCYNDALIKKSLLKTNILKLNTEELAKLNQLMDFKGNPSAFIYHMMNAYSLEIVSLTKGESGSVLFTKKGFFSRDTVNGINVVDTVGAGDAYAAMLAAGLLKQWQPETILHRASMFASRMCEIKGAIPDSPSFYESFKSLFRNG